MSRTTNIPKRLPSWRRLPSTNASYLLTNAQLSSAGTYLVVVTNLAGAVTSSVATLTVICPNQAQLVTSSTNLTGVGPITTDGVYLYVGVGISISSVPIGGGAAGTVYPSAAPSAIAGLTQIGSNLFWIDANFSSNAIYTGSSSGGAVRSMMPSIMNGVSITADGARLYLADACHSLLYSLQPDGSGLTQIGPARCSGCAACYTHLSTVAVSGGVVYVADSASGGAIPLALSIPATGAGAFSTNFTGSPLIRPVAIAAGGGRVYLADPDAGNMIWQLPLGGGAPTPLVCGAPFSQINGLAYYNNSLYVTDSGSTNGPGAIYKVDVGVRLSAPQFITNSFQFHLAGPAGVYVIQATTNLTSWVALATNTATNGALDFTDPAQSNLVRRFYRALAQ